MWGRDTIDLRHNSRQASGKLRVANALLRVVRPRGIFHHTWSSGLRACWENPYARAHFAAIFATQPLTLLGRLLSTHHDEAMKEPYQITAGSDV
jgi:hypothetical protein